MSESDIQQARTVLGCWKIFDFLNQESLENKTDAYNKKSDILKKKSDHYGKTYTWDTLTFYIIR